MRLIHPITFKMHKATLNQEDNYQFGDITGSMFRWSNAPKHGTSLLEPSPKEAHSSDLFDWIDYEVSASR